MKQKEIPGLLLCVLYSVGISISVSYEMSGHLTILFSSEVFALCHRKALCMTGVFMSALKCVDLIFNILFAFFLSFSVFVSNQNVSQHGRLFEE